MSPLTGVLSEAWTLYRRYAVHFLAIAFSIYLVTAIIVALLTAFASWPGVILAAIIQLISAFLVQAALVRAVQDVRDGQVDLNLGQTVSSAVPFVLPVAGASILAGIGIAIGFAFLVVPGLILLTIWSLIVPAIVVGRSGALQSFGRSWQAIRGNAWPAFGTYVLVFLIWVAFDIVLSLILLPAGSAVRGFVSSVISGTVVAPFLALVVTLVYYRLTAAHDQVLVGQAAGQPIAQPPGQPAGGYYPPPAQPQGGYYPPPGQPGSGYPQSGPGNVPPPPS